MSTKTTSITTTVPPSSDDTKSRNTSCSNMSLADAIDASNQIRPSLVFSTTERTESVKLRIDQRASDDNGDDVPTSDDDIARRKPVSIPALLNRTVTLFADTVALRFKESANGNTAKNGGGDGNDTTAAWQSVTYKQYQANVLRTAKMFLKLGLEAHHSVGVLAFNSPEWFYSCLAAMHAGGIIAGIYTTNSPEAVQHVLLSSHANIVVVDDAKQMAKIRQIRASLPLLKAAIQTQGPYPDYVNGTDGYYRWSDVYGDEEALDQQNDLLVERLAAIRVNECCSLVYTSGTVGQPKGVMLSHDALTWSAFSVGNRLPNLKLGGETIISYLPLSHIAAQMIDTLVAVSFAVTVYFADKDALKGTLVRTLHDARPTRFMGVPRVYEKIHEKMLSIGAQSGGLRRTIAAWAKAQALHHWLAAIAGRPTDTFQYRTARYLIMGRIKEALGLDRCSTIVSAAAPMAPELKRYFLSIDLPILEAFGMSETAGAHCIGTIERFNLDTVGRTLTGARTTLANVDTDEQGEILMAGRNVFMGYIDEAGRTADALDTDGWLHSGDLGRIDADGFVYVTGRLKELIITAGGENVPPMPIEHLILKELAVLSNAFLVGDRRKYLTVLVTLKTEMDLETGGPNDDLSAETREWLRTMDLDYMLLSEVLAAGPCPKVMDAITAAVARANQHSTSNAQKVQKFAILPHDFSMPTGELGPTLKVKRSVVAQMYADVIDSLYE